MRKKHCSSEESFLFGKDIYGRSVFVAWNDVEVFAVYDLAQWSQYGMLWKSTESKE